MRIRKSTTMIGTSKRRKPVKSPLSKEEKKLPKRKRNENEA